MDQWIENAVFSIAKRAGVPTDRIMTMRWILTWKDAPDNTVAKARLVIKGFTDPDLTTIRSATAKQDGQTHASADGRKSPLHI